MLKRYFIATLLTVVSITTYATDDILACHAVSPQFSGVGDKANPDVKDIMALGQLGGTLCPTIPTSQSPATQNSAVRSFSTPGTQSGVLPSDVTEQNKLFARGMELWNRHEYEAAAQLLNQYLTTYPDGLWAGEAELHLGCEARFNGRYNEADRLFSNLLNKYGGSEASGNRRITDKTTSRLAVLRILENNPDEASALFSQLAEHSDDWRLRTYAQSWLQRISQMKQDQQFLADCGYRALENILVNQGIDADLSGYKADSKGQSLLALGQLAKKYDLKLQALKLPAERLGDIALPAIAQIDRSSTGGAGHYWIIESRKDDKLQLFDAQAGRRFEQTLDEFSGEWSGNLLAFESDDKLSSYILTMMKPDRFLAAAAVSSDLNPISDREVIPVTEPLHLIRVQIIIHHPTNRGVPDVLSGKSILPTSTFTFMTFRCGTAHLTGRTLLSSSATTVSLLLPKTRYSATNGHSAMAAILLKIQARPQWPLCLMEPVSPLPMTAMAGLHGLMRQLPHSRKYRRRNTA